MRTRAVAMAAIAVSATAAPTLALAVPVTWHLNGVTLTDGGVASGSFVYDMDTNSYSAINITTSGGALASSTYVGLNGVFSTPVQIVALTSSGAGVGSPVTALLFTAPLTNAGGVVPLSFTPPSGEGVCNVGCTGYTGGSTPLRAYNAGSVTTTPPPGIPTLTEWGMILFGLILAGGAALTVQRRRLGT